MGLTTRLQHAWNAFRDADHAKAPVTNIGYGGYNYRPDVSRLRVVNERSIVSSIINRIGIDVAQLTFHHIRTDENGRYKEQIKSGLDYCLNTSANIDQTGRAFIQDAVMSLLDEGHIAIVPVDTTLNPKVTGSFDVESLRVGKVIQWYPEHVMVRLYNDKIGDKQEITLPKKMVAIIENPLYAVMNEPNSTLRRLTYKLNLLDTIDEQNGSGKIDLIIQLPYVVRSEAKRQEAEKRRKDIEMQLAQSKYGIAYTDGTERVTQLNRPAENNLFTQVEYLTNMLYNQLGMTQGIFDGTADEATTLNYRNRTIEPIAAALVDGMNRTFLTKTARSQGQAIRFFSDPFKLVPVSQIAEIADKFTRNEILSSNEIRAIIGYKPVDDPRADELRNKNLNQNNQDVQQDPVTTEEYDDDIFIEEE